MERKHRLSPINNMSKKHFYSHLIQVESIVIELDNMDLTEKEKMHLASLVDSNLHHTILDVIMSELSDSDKQIFLKHLSNNDHSQIWEHLNGKVDNIEDKIKTAIEDLKKDLHQDINEAKRLKKGEK